MNHRLLQIFITSVVLHFVAINANGVELLTEENLISVSENELSDNNSSIVNCTEECTNDDTENTVEKDDSINNNQPKDEKLCRVIWQVNDSQFYETLLI